MLACWLCQQATEKAIKTAPVLEKIHFPRTHDLNILLGMLAETWLVKSRHTTLSDLTAWTVNARYPGDWPEPTCEDAVGARSMEHSVYDRVTAEFGHRACLSVGRA